MLTRVLRTLPLVAGCAAAVTVAWQLSAAPLQAVSRGGGRSLVEVVTAGSACALMVCVAWLVATTALELATVLIDEASPGGATARAVRRAGDRWSPTVTRHLVALTLGVAVGASTAGPAVADTGLGGLPLPDRTNGSVPVARAPRAVPLRTATEVVVQRGDTLWAIASRFLGPAAHPADVTRAWHRMHHVNAKRIGDDPDLILPGTRLVVPDAYAPRGKEAQ